MDLNRNWCKTIIASALTIALTGCGSSDSDEATQKNVAPSISSSALITATEDTEYRYQVTVTDPDDANNGTDLGFSLTNPPEGMNVSDTGLITWTPTEGILTSGLMSVIVTDGGEDNAVASGQSFEIIVTPVNDAPTVTSVDEQTVIAGSAFSYQLIVTDVDDVDIENDISFEMITGPAELSISASGLISYDSTVTETTKTDISIQIADGGEDSAAPAIVNFTLEEQFFITLNGMTINYFNGEAISNSQIAVSNGNEIIQSIDSNESGAFSASVQDTQLTERMTFTADATGYSEAALSISNNEVAQVHNLLLQPVHTTVNFDVTQATELTVEGSLLVSLPENSLVDADGNLAATAVVAELTVINPAIDIEMMPGDMLTTTETGEIAPIESFGAITVSFEDESGNPLQLAEGKTAEIQIPVVGFNPPATIPLYYFDEVSGLWIEEGEATLITDNGAQYYAGNVSHFTTWNADRIYETVMINGCVEDAEGNRLAGARVISDGRDYLGRSLTYSEDDGTFSLPVRMNSTILLGATIGFQSRTSIIDSTDSDLTLASCLVLSEALTKITLNWGEAPRDLDSHLYITDVDGNQNHVYFYNPSVVIEETIIDLDVDDVTSFGPEVISIPEFPVEGTYDYYVYNFSGSPEIDPASTRVEVIFENEQHLFTPPTENITRWWHVASIEKMTDGELVFTSHNEWVDGPSSSQAVEEVPLQAVEATMSIKKLDSVVKGLISSKYYAEK
ncbi:putative Ig domain-containing protein [Shewanella sp. 10N.286.48.A6]|uniref:putative Ig domain-containing protein n=1 Tax=Shewanella sp. 10N.286.48.A6 TaxID=1880833 RepID=UPI000C827AE6|nr:putative Ig domain-containing protein [Shewanella sp. 10N.286.48.A6]PMH97059.1 hypothetical protein BCU55_18925 [Shewanella sp. 10N.286.48.A6]